VEWKVDSASFEEPVVVLEVGSDLFPVAVEEWKVGYFAFEPVSGLEVAQFADLGSPVCCFVFAALLVDQPVVAEWQVDFAVSEEPLVALEIGSYPSHVAVEEWKVDYSAFAPVSVLEVAVFSDLGFPVYCFVFAP
jgi:hypothetical protein